MRSCQNCKVELVPVEVVDQAPGPLLSGLAYTERGRAEKSIWSGKLKNQTGTLHAYVCPKCDLVAWYAHAGEV